MAQGDPHRIVILGGGFAGIYTATHLEKLLGHRTDVEISIVSRNNYFLMTPLLFEAGSGVLEPRHAVSPIRPMFKKVRFVEAEIQAIDFEAKQIRAMHSPDQYHYTLPYDQVVLALGGETNRNIIPGSELALGFKTLGDGILLRNKIIDLFEQADIETDSVRRQELLTIVIIGGGLVGIELMGELTEFTHNLLRSYPRIPKNLIRFYLVEAMKRVLPEMEEDLAAYAQKTLESRGVKFYLDTKVEKIEARAVRLPASAPEQVINAETIVLAAGVVPSSLLKKFDLEKAKNGKVVVEATMRYKARPEVWAIGDCASIPDKNGKPYPPLAQHAIREGKVLARNIAAVVRTGGGAAPVLEPFVYDSLGTLASLGHFKGVGKVMKFKIYGFVGWWVWRSYYLFQMPRWNRRFRIMMDWAIALLFQNDVVKLDVAREPTVEDPKAEGREGRELSTNEHK